MARIINKMIKNGEMFYIPENSDNNIITNPKSDNKNQMIWKYKILF